MMEVRSDPDLTMDGSEGVSLPQKGKVVAEGHFPSRDLACSSSNLSKKGSFCASGETADPADDDAITGQSSTADASIDIVRVSEAAVTVSEGLFSDQKRSNQDLVGNESCKREDLKNGSSWASSVGTSSDEAENTGKSSRFVTAYADKALPAAADATGSTDEQSKLRPAAGKDWSAVVAGSGRIKGSARAWVKCVRNETGPVLSSGIKDPAASANLMRNAAGAIVDSAHTTSDLRSSNPQRLDSVPIEGNIPEVSCLGLAVEDFPPLRPLSNLGTREASVSVGGTVQSKARTEVKPSLISVSTSSQTVQMGSRNAKRFGKGRGVSADAKISHNWRSLFVNCPKPCSPLAFYSPTTVDGQITINPPAEAVVEGVGLWEGCLVGQFFDKRLPLHVVMSLVERLWGKHEIPEISTTDNGLYIFRFKDLAARDWVLENGPWYLAGRPIILRFWKPGMEMLNVQITSLPIWVKFFNIPLEYWTATSLGCIASAVGIPLHLDTLTENHSRLSFARICIEVDVNCTFPKSALLDLGNGNYSTIRIEYPWVPQKCSHCKIFGHSHMKCQSGKEMADSGNCLDHFDMRRAKDCVEASDSTPVSNAVNTVDDIGHHTTPGKAGNVQITDIQEKLTSNTFDCLTICDDASNLEETVDRTTDVVSVTTIPNGKSTLQGLGSLESSKLDHQNIADFSDTSPICETFKHIKRIDELDYLPLSKKKLKKLRKQSHAKSAKSSSSVDTLSPYIADID